MAVSNHFLSDNLYFSISISIFCFSSSYSIFFLSYEALSRLWSIYSSNILSCFSCTFPNARFRFYNDTSLRFCSSLKPCFSSSLNTSLNSGGKVILSIASSNTCCRYSCLTDLSEQLNRLLVQ